MYKNRFIRQNGGEKSDEHSNPIVLQIKWFEITNMSGTRRKMHSMLKHCESLEETNVNLTI